MLCGLIIGRPVMAGQAVSFPRRRTGRIAMHYSCGWSQMAITRRRWYKSAQLAVDLTRRICKLTQNMLRRQILCWWRCLLGSSRIRTARGHCRQRWHPIFPDLDCGSMLSGIHRLLMRMAKSKECCIMMISGQWPQKRRRRSLWLQNRQKKSLAWQMTGKRTIRFR